MTRRLLALALSAAIVSPASASSIFTPETVFPSGGTAQFPGDIATYTMWWGLRAYSAAVAATGTQKALDLRRVSDNATCTALIGTNGDLDLTVGTPCNSSTQTVTAWIGASTATVSKIYDQTNGNACSGASCDLVQATAGNQPNLLLTGCGGSGTLPCLQGGPNQGSGALTSANNFTTSVPSSRSLVGDRPVSSSLQIQEMSVVIAQSSKALFPHAANQWDCGGLTATAADAAWHAANCSVTTGVNNTNINVDGTETNGTTSQAILTGLPTIIQMSGHGGAFTVLFGEAGYADNVLWSLGTRIALCHNQRIYYGTGGSC
jgi:hypothetical protein